MGFGQNQGAMPANLPPGTPQIYWGPFLQGFNAAKKALRRKSCSAFFGGAGPQTMDGTTYRFLNLNDPTVGAATVGPDSVFVNSAGPYMTFTPTPGQAGPFGRFWTQSQFRGFILLHELGHELSGTTGFQPDSGSPLNQVQSGWVLNHCF